MAWQHVMIWRLNHYDVTVDAEGDEHEAHGRLDRAQRVRERERLVAAARAEVDDDVARPHERGDEQRHVLELLPGR